MSRVHILFVDEAWDLENPIWGEDGYLYSKLRPGSATWLRDSGNRIAALEYVCPCGCGTVSSLPLSRKDGERAWSWDGDVERPTIKPSIFKKTPCRWHGFLTEGVFHSV